MSTVSGDQLAVGGGGATGLDELLDAFPDAPDGYSHAVGGDKIRIPRKIFNAPGLDARGETIPHNVFYDTVTEQTTPAVTAVLVDTRGSRAWTEFLDAEDRTQVICSSPDGVHGTLTDTGEVRKCEGCPDRVWFTTGKGKRGVHCHDVYEVFGVDLDTYTPFIVTFKRTSEPAWISHLNKHHLLKRKATRTRPVGNQPLWSYRVKLALKLSENGKYATPVIDVLGVMTVDEAKECLAVIGALREAMHAGRVEETVDTSFDPNEFQAT